MASTNIEIFKWTNCATELLIGEIKSKYERLNRGVKKSTYQEIADIINKELGTDLSHGQIDSKWKGLKRTFRQIREHSYKTGKTRPWRFYEKVEEILSLGEDIETAPEVLSSENTRYSDESVGEFIGLDDKEINEESFNEEEEVNEEVTDDGDEEVSEEEPVINSRSKYERKYQPPLKRRYIEIDAREDAIERRHRERMEVANRFIDIFEEMVRKMP